MALGEPVRNGNELALELTRIEAPARAQLVKERTGMYHTFRYLKVIERAGDPATTNEVRLLTIEPSSDLKVLLFVSGKVSLGIVGTVQTGECVAAKGRVTGIGASAADPIVVRPATVQYKDRIAPKAGGELLKEVDPTAH